MMQRLQSWFHYLLPSAPALDTTQQRERYRKARLLTIVLLGDIALTLLPMVSYTFTGLFLGELFFVCGRRSGHWRAVAQSAGASGNSSDFLPDADRECGACFPCMRGASNARSCKQTVRKISNNSMCV